MQEKHSKERILSITKKVLHDLKMGTAISPPLVSLNDLIPRALFPFYRLILRPAYIKRFGIEKIQLYERHSYLSDLLRTKAQEMANAQNIPSPHSTAQIAISLCGFGECSETSNRAVTELIRHFKAEDYNLPLSIIVTLGNKKDIETPIIESEYNYYSHAFVIIGTIPDDFNLTSHDLSEFKKLNEDCILLDPSLGIIGRANETEILLKDLFKVYGINRLASNFQCFLPFEHWEIVELIHINAKKISDSLQKELDLSPATVVKNKPEKLSQPKLLSGQIKFFDVNRSSEELVALTLSMGGRVE